MAGNIIILSTIDKSKDLEDMSNRKYKMIK